MLPQRPTSSELGPVQLISVSGGALSLALFAMVAFVPRLVGRELECFPILKEALIRAAGIGGLGCAIALATGAVLAGAVVFQKAPPTFGRLGGLAIALLVVALIETPIFGGSVRTVFGVSWGHSGPNCRPAGLFAAAPQTWWALSRAMGYRSWP